MWSYTNYTQTMKEIISHYIHNGSNVYSVLLDASKAFDKVHYGKLFKLLMDRNIPAYCIRFILDSYIRQRVHTFWQGEYSDVIQTLNGVRQGGVLSPILFCIYFDELLQRLEDHSVGCHIGNEYYGAVCYADDLTLLCPTRYGLQSMVNVCEMFGREHCVTFNVAKSYAISYGPQYSSKSQYSYERQPH